MFRAAGAIIDGTRPAIRGGPRRKPTTPPTSVLAAHRGVPSGSAPVRGAPRAARERHPRFHRLFGVFVDQPVKNIRGRLLPIVCHLRPDQTSSDRDGHMQARKRPGGRPFACAATTPYTPCQPHHYLRRVPLDMGRGVQLYFFLALRSSSVIEFSRDRRGPGGAQRPHWCARPCPPRCVFLRDPSQSPLRANNRP